MCLGGTVSATCLSTRRNDYRGFGTRKRPQDINIGERKHGQTRRLTKMTVWVHQPTFLPFEKREPRGWAREPGQKDSDKKHLEDAGWIEVLAWLTKTKIDFQLSRDSHGFEDGCSHQVHRFMCGKTPEEVYVPSLLFLSFRLSGATGYDYRRLFALPCFFSLCGSRACFPSRVLRC